MNFGKEVTLDELLKEIVDLFFPHGKSTFQGLLLDNVSVSLATFNGEPLSHRLQNGEPFTVEGYALQIQRNPIRIYLHSETKEEVDESQASTQASTQASVVQANTLPVVDTDTSPSHGESESDWQLNPVSNPRTRLRLHRRDERSSPDEESLHLHMSDEDASPSHVSDDDSSQSLSTSSPHLSLSWMAAGTPDVFFRIDADDMATPNTTVKAELQEGFLSLLDSLESEEVIKVSRMNILQDAFKLYENANLPTHRIQVEFLGESGDDFGGLSKDFFTIVWKDLLRDFFKGEDAVIPFVPLHQMRESKDKFILIGRILAHTAATMQMIPPRVSRCCLLGIVFNDMAVSEKLLLQDFLLYLPPEDRYLVQLAIHQYSHMSDRQKNDLVNFYSIHDMQAAPIGSKIREQILSIAQNEVCDKPAALVAKIRQGIPQVHMDLFWALLTTDGINYLFNEQRPTARKALHVLQTEDVLRPDEERSLYFFRQFVGGLDQEDLANLLLFITGSTTMPDKISIIFRNVTGEQRCPLVHTCSNQLDLASTYSSVQELKREFRAVLACQHSFEMSML